MYGKPKLHVARDEDNKKIERRSCCPSEIKEHNIGQTKITAKYNRKLTKFTINLYCTKIVTSRLNGTGVLIIYEYHHRPHIQVYRPFLIMM